MAQYSEEQLNQIKKALQEAKANPDDPKSREIEKRLRSGQLNPELKALGLNPVPIEKPKIDINQVKEDQRIASEQQLMAANESLGLSKEFKEAPKEATQPVEESSFIRAIKDIPSDLQETAANLKKTGEEAASYLGDVYTSDDYNLAQKFMATAGQAAKGGVSALDEMVMGTGKMFLSDKAEKKLGELVREAVTGTNIEKTMKSVLEWREGLDKDDKLIAEASLPIAEFISEFLILGKAAPAAREAISETGDVIADVSRKTLPTIKKTADKGEEAFRFTAQKVGEGIDGYRTQRAPERLARQQARVEDAMGRVTQAGADPKTIESAQRALSELDTSDVKTYADLNAKQRDRIESLANKQDEVLEAYTETVTPDTASRYSRVGDQTVVDTPVQDALEGLKTAYTKGGESTKAVEIDQIINKFNSEGLTLKEVNDIARQYNIEFRDRAFTKTGDPKAGYNAEAYENIRKGVKDVVDERVAEDSAFKALDRSMSDLYRTLRATGKLEDQVAKKLQKLEKEGMIFKVGKGVGSAVDVLTFGGPRAFISRFLPKGYATSNSMSVLDIEKNLQKYLKELDRIEELRKTNPKAAQEAINSWIENDMSPGLGIKATMSDDLKNAFSNSEHMDGFVEAAQKTEGGKNMTREELESIYDNLTAGRPAFSKGATPSQTTKEGVSPELVNKTYYHGTSRENADSILDGGVDASKSNTLDEGEADLFASFDQGYASGWQPADEMGESIGENLKITPNKDAQIYDYQKYGEKTVDQLKEEGYDAIATKSGLELQIFNPDAFKIERIYPKATDDLLDGWVTRDVGEQVPDFTPDQIAEFKALDLPKGTDGEITLYRAGPLNTNKLSSWTSDPDIAEMHSEINKGDVTERMVSPDEILVSLTDLPPDLKKKYKVIEDEMEYILLPLE